MALLRRILTSSARIQFRLLSSSARHTYASPQAGGFRDAPHMLQHRDAFSLRRLLTSSSTPPPSPTHPPQGSSAGRGKPEHLVRFKFWSSVLGLLFTVLVADEGYRVYLACRGDVPSQNRAEDALWIPSTNMDAKALLDNVPCGSFYMVVGWPGIGKTTQLCDAAKDRGAAIYLDAAAQKSFEAIQATIDQRYRSLRLNFMSWILPNTESGLKTLSFWVRLFRRKHLVFIVDHIDKLAQADVLELVSWAKTEADHKEIKVILVVTEPSTALISNSDTITRGRLVECYPPSAQETREALRKFINTHPEKYNLDVEKCLYLRGTRPTEYMGTNLHATEEYLMKQFRERHASRDFCDVDFWFTLLVAGSNGVSLVKDAALPGYYVPEIHKVLSEPCILYYNRKVYFISGRSREHHAALVLSAYGREVNESSAEVKRLSAEVERLSADKLAKQNKKLANEKKKLAEENKKLMMAKERIAKIQECMSNKSYEAYGPLYQTQGPVKAEPV